MPTASTTTIRKAGGAELGNPTSSSAVGSNKVKVFVKRPKLWEMEENMKQNIVKLVGLLTFMALIAIGGSGFAQTYKIGYVDGDIIFSQYPDAIEVQKKIEAELKKRRDKFQPVYMDKLRELQELQENLRTQAALLVEEKRKEKEEEINRKSMELQNLQLQQEQEFAKWREEQLKPVREAVDAVINKIAKVDKYDFIVDISAAPGLIVYAKEQYDLTKRVLRELGVKTPK